MAKPVFRSTGTKAIVMVDDEQLVLNATQRRLVAAGYQVIYFTKWRAALHSITEGYTDCDLVLTDWEMPDPDGLSSGMTFITELRAIGFEKPIILWSGNDEVDDIKPDDSSGPSAVLNKGKAERLLDLIARELTRAETG